MSALRRADVIVLGGGIIGCALAEELARRGQRVTLIERGAIGAEASVAAAGILAAQMDLTQPGPLFDLCQAARRMYPRWVEHLQRRSGVDVEFHVDGILYLALTGREQHLMDRQVQWQAKLGVNVKRWSPKEVRRREPAVDGSIKRGYLFSTEAQVDNSRLMHALAVACRAAGVELRERTSVRRVAVQRESVRGVETDHGTIAAPVVVNCLGGWAAMGGAFPVPLPVEPVRGQILAFRGPRRLFRHAVMSGRGYVVQRRAGRLIRGRTVERVGFDKSLTFAGMPTILSGLHSLSSQLEQAVFLEAWAGLRPYTADRLPILGATSIEGLYAATGHFRHGILLAPITATVMAELIVRGRSSFNLAALSPRRFAA